MTTQYQNPVYSYDFADPFVLKTNGEYFAYGTAAAGSDGKIFPVLRSTDLVHWEKLEGALVPLENPRAFSYWAPEVAEKDGKFFMFYSASTSHSDEHHRLRVAIAEHPAGPFVDSGKELMPESGFTIDASPFRDPITGKNFLFYATDYESDEPTGTGLAVVPLSDDLKSVTASAQLVVRAQADWQIYERNRNYKGKTWEKWNCVEGPNVVYHEGQYYCFYSGGAWHGNDYGVGFAVADNPLGPWEDKRAIEGATVLRAIPGKVIGPGHCSIVLGPDDKTHYMVYHAWNLEKTARRLCIDPIDWTPDGPKVDGPTTEKMTLR